MFVPVMRCEEADLYFIVVECIQAASRLPASLGNIVLLLRPGVIRTQRGAHARLQPSADRPSNGPSATGDTTRGRNSSEFFFSFVLRGSQCVACVSWSEADCIGFF